MGQNNYTWICPGGVTSIIAEAWGSGGGGGFTGGGGGAGAYVRQSGLIVVPTTGYIVNTGIGGGAAINGDDSNITIGATVPNAKGGLTSGAPGVGGFGGTAAASTGTTKFSGGDGGPSGADSGGGGGSGGDTGSGGVGGTPAGAAAVHRGGSGGTGGSGGSGSAPPPFATAPGGGGGASNGGGTPSAGFDGAVVIWEDLGVWPPVGQIPLASFGSPPVDPTKARKSVRFM